MRTVVCLLVLACLAGTVLADYVSTYVAWPGWKVSSTEDLYIGRKHHQYPLTYLFDGKPDTAWVYSGVAKGKDRKVSLTIEPTKPMTIDAIRLMNGYNKSPEIFQRNNRITGLRLTCYSSDEPWKEKPTPVEAKLPDQMGWHRISLARRQVTQIKIEVTAMVQGPDDDVCISELELWDGTRKVDLRMPGAVLLSEGDECGCGWEGAKLIDLQSQVLTDTRYEFEAAPAYDPTGRYVAYGKHIKGDPQDRHDLCVFDMVEQRVVYRRPLLGQTLAAGNAIRWIEPDKLEVRFFPEVWEKSVPEVQPIRVPEFATQTLPRTEQPGTR